MILSCKGLVFLFNSVENNNVPIIHLNFDFYLGSLSCIQVIEAFTCISFYNMYAVFKFQFLIHSYIWFVTCVFIFFKIATQLSQQHLLKTYLCPVICDMIVIIYLISIGPLVCFWNFYHPLVYL